MKLSIVIVNYNVKHFLEQCLRSVEAASKNIEVEVFVVDNNSVDGSVGIISKKFPEVKIIANDENLGFSKANNQAIKLAKGEYVLLLNPDTVVSEDTFTKTLDFMDQHSEVGGLGVKMIDGRGNFLPESKRALPTPRVAFYKTFGLSYLFPKSHKFGKYHLTYLPHNEVNEVDVLPGAFMLIRKKVLDKVGLLDETFFMYGEDIDLSYRIQLGGYKNYYYPETTIIHYKGESTKKSSVNYVVVFYNAMLIFARKHFSKRNQRLISLLIKFAIYFRATVAIIRRFFMRYLQPFTDAIITYTGIALFSTLWEQIFFSTQQKYPPGFYFFVIPAYLLIWQLALFLTGGYDKPVRFFNLLKGLFWGTVFILTVYALLPLDFRFSRMVILFGIVWFLVNAMITRFIFSKIWPESFSFKLSKNKKRLLFVGKPEEIEKNIEIVRSSAITPEFIGIVCDNNTSNDMRVIGNTGQLEEIVRINNIDEVIFNAGDISSKLIIESMLTLEKYNLEYKIASTDGISIIGSSSIDTAGELYSLDFNSLAKAANMRQKRMFDIVIAFVLLIGSPLIIWFYKVPAGYLKNMFNVLIGNKTIIGYNEEVDISSLPKIKKGVLRSTDTIKIALDEKIIERANLKYARDYNFINDLGILLKSGKYLSRRVK